MQLLLAVPEVGFSPLPTEPGGDEGQPLQGPAGDGDTQWTAQGGEV